MKRIIVKCQKEYDIVIDHNYDHLIQKLRIYQKNKIFLFLDSNVDKIRTNSPKDKLSEFCQYKYVVPSGETSKSLDHVYRAYQYLVENKASRDDLIVAFGGGVIGDMIGFTAATFLRGIDYIQVPTTLLSQIDSSIGGKTAVNFLDYKNNIGIFYQPVFVFINLSILQSLPAQEFSSGMAEAVVHAVIDSKWGLFDFIEKNYYSIVTKRRNKLEQLVWLSCIIKRDVVEKDEFEKGVRQYLNLGHTIGHAIESYYNYELKHGECVALGLTAVCYISVAKKMLSEETASRIINLLNLFHLPTYISKINTDEILGILKHDKKIREGRNNFVLIRDVGKLEIVSIENIQEEVLPALLKLQKPANDKQNYIKGVKVLNI